MACAYCDVLRRKENAQSMQDRNPKRRREKGMRGDLHDGQPWRGSDPKQRTQAKTERQMQREAETDSTSSCLFSLFSSSSSSSSSATAAASTHSLRLGPNRPQDFDVLFLFNSTVRE